jgi:uncharacterized membrane protein
MLFGFLLNVVTPRWFSWGSWFVLHTMGFAMALAPLWRRVSTRALVGATVLVLAATPFIQTWLDTPLQLTNPRMADLDLPGGPLRLAVAEGQFPIFPWLAFYLAGFASGRWIADGRGRNVALLGASIMAASALGHLAWRLGAFAFAPKLLVWRAFGLQLTFFPATVAIAGLLLGGALLFIAGAFWLEERRPLRADHPLVTLGRGSLTLLMLHVPLFRELTRPIDFQLGGMHIAFDLGLWRALSAPATLTVVLCLVALATWATWVWQRHGYRYGAEWALRRLAG